MHRGRSLLLMLACLPACPSQPVPTDCTQVLRSGTLATGPLFPATSATVTAGIQFIACDSKHPVTGAAEVVGPADQPVEATVTTEVAPSSSPVASQLASQTLDAGLPSDGLTALVHVTFTPPQPGLYHLTARFDPGLGTVQADVNVLDDRRSAVFHTLPMPIECNDFDLQLGVGLCLSVDTLYAVVDGGQVASIPALAFAADGADVWAIESVNNAVNLTLNSLTASGSLTNVARIDLASNGPGTTVLRSSGQRVAGAVPDSMATVLFEAWMDGGIAIGEFTSLGMQVGTVALQWAPGAGAVFGGEQVFTNGTHDEVCEFSVLDGGLRCVIGTGFTDPGPSTIGSDGAALWTQDPMGALTAWSALADGGFTSTAVSFGSRLPFLPPTENGPVVRDGAPAGVQLPSSTPPYLLQAYGLPPAFTDNPTSWGSTARLYWEWHLGNGGTIVYVLR